jgi:glycosyltransferase involved in cell wall biosynthesis
MPMREAIVLITSLDVGGAETYLLRMISSRPDINWKVFTIKDYGRSAEELSGSGFNVKEFGISHVGIRNFFLFIRAIFSKPNPTVITFLYHADLVVRLISLFRRIDHIMMIRHSDTSFKNNSIITSFTLLLLRIIAKFNRPKIIFNSVEARENHFNIGIIGRENHVVHNGVFIGKTHFKPLTRRTKAIGILGRIHPIKGQVKFINALQSLSDTTFSCVHLAGRHANKNNAELVEAVSKIKLETVLHGEITNITKFLDLIDVLVIPSISESFPNVMLEAYLLGVPVAAFKVGDISLVVLEEGQLATPGNYEQLNLAISSLMNLNDNDYEELRKRCVAKVSTHFDALKKFDELFYLIEGK